MPLSPVQTRVPYFDLTRQYARIGGEIERAIAEVAASGRYILGNTVENFEKTFAEYCGVPHGVGTASGTDALVFCLKALGIKPGDEVVVPSFTFAATAFSVIHAGARPVFAEVDETLYTLDPASVEKAITRKTRAIIPVHLYGQLADMDSIMKIARRHRLKVVEDACQSHGASRKGKRAGVLGDAAAFSFYPTKNLGGLGDGGMVVTRNPKLLEALRRLRNLGRLKVGEPHKVVGCTSRLDAIQAAALSVKLKYLDEHNDKRRALADQYRKLLSGTPLILPVEASGNRHVYHLFVARVRGGLRDDLRAHLAERGIDTLVHYPHPVHLEPACAKQAARKVRLPLTEKLCRQIVSLPMFPEMTREEVTRVSEAIREFFDQSR